MTLCSYDILFIRYRVHLNLSTVIFLPLFQFYSYHQNFYQPKFYLSILLTNLLLASMIKDITKHIII